jgi:hypothetical protein
MPRCAARATLVSPSVATSHRTAQPRSAPPQRIHAPPPSPTATARQPNPRQARHPHAASPIHPPEHPPDRFTPHQRTTRQRCCCPVPSQTAQQPPPHAQLYAARRHPPPCHRARSCCARCAPTLPAESRTQPHEHAVARPTSATPREHPRRTSQRRRGSVASRACNATRSEHSTRRPPSRTRTRAPCTPPSASRYTSSSRAGPAQLPRSCCQPCLQAAERPQRVLRTRSARTWQHCTSGRRLHVARSAHRAASPADTSHHTRTPAAAGAARHHQFTAARKPAAVHVRAPAQPRLVQPVRDVAGVSDAHPALSPKPPATPSAVSTPCASLQAIYAPLSRADRLEAHEGRQAAVQALRRPRGAR